MNRWLLISIMSLQAFSTGNCQEVVLSSEERFSLRSQGLEILGKYQGISYVYVYDNRHEINAYTEELRLKWKKQIILPGKKYIAEGLFLNNGIFTFFYSNYYKDTKYIYVRQYDPEFNRIGEDVMIDSLKRGFGQGFQQLNFTRSEDQNHILIYSVKDYSNSDDTFYYLVVNDKMKLTGRGNIDLHTAEKRIALVDVLIDNRGNVYSVLGEYRDQGLNHATRYWVLSSENNFREMNPYTVEAGENRYMNNALFKVDNTNESLVVAGFYSTDDKRPPSAEGIFFKRLDMFLTDTTHVMYQEFGHDFIAKVRRVSKSMDYDRLYSFLVDEIILRQDGGALIISESFYRTYREVTEVYSPYLFPHSGQVSVTYHYDDVIIVSVNPDGIMDWKNILAKNQISSSDQGRYSSYALVNTGANLIIIYNDEINASTNLMQYVIDIHGKVDRDIIFNSRKRDLLLLPAKGAQLSAREFIIPSIKKNKLRFVKLAY